MVITYFHVTYPFFSFVSFSSHLNLSETINKSINIYAISTEFRTMLGKVIYNTEPALKRYSVVETRVTEVVKKSIRAAADVMVILCNRIFKTKAIHTNWNSLG